MKKLRRSDIGLMCELYLGVEHSQSTIARIMGVDKSTVQRNIKEVMGLPKNPCIMKLNSKI